MSAQQRHHSGNRWPSADRASGTIKRLVADGGFGFIREDGGEEFFFHRSACEALFSALTPGQAVTFTRSQGRKGPRAMAVQLK